MSTELNQDQLNTEIEKSNFKIYSKGAIYGFSIFFSTVFGGVLLMQNLKDLGKKKEANLVLGISLLYTAISIVIINLLPSTVSNPSLFLNLIGGGILSYFFLPKYIPNFESFSKKAIWKPLIISLLISIPFVLALIYSE